MKILSTEAIKQADALTIAHEPISSIDLMERASKAFVHYFCRRFSVEEHNSVAILCARGNNGGDGLAVARLLHGLGYSVSVLIVGEGAGTADFETNRKALPKELPCKLLYSAEELLSFAADTLLIDALLGTGLQGELREPLRSIVLHINELPNTLVSIDIPTGLLADAKTTGPCIRANYTVSFHCPKLAFLFPDNYEKVGEFDIADIGLHKESIAQLSSQNFYVERSSILAFLKTREKFAHKGVFGHALLVMGSHGKMGAAILATRACLRAGVGLVTVHVPTCGYEVMQITVPEAMVSLDEDEHIFTRVYDLHKYSTLALGCGLSTKNKTRNALCYVLKNTNKPTVLDADALNILGQSPDWLEYIPQNSILTPHPKEFERLFGRSTEGFERNALQRQKAQELGVYIILKGANSCIASPEGDCYFNSTGNPGMGTAGSGDVLTGILSGLLAQHYSPLEACLLGVYLHGLAGDLAAAKIGEEALTASDIIEHLGPAFLELRKRVD